MRFARLIKLFRALVPRRRHVLLDAALPSSVDDDSRAQNYETVIGNTSEGTDPFILNRFREGLRWRHVLEALLPPGSIRILDVGAGNGAIELALAGNRNFLPFSVEESWNWVAVEIHERNRVPFRRVRADASALPFRDGAFGAVTFLETLEHVREPVRVGEEICRALSDGGIAILTTPARYRFAFRPDPHFGIRGLVLLPPSLQRWIARHRGFDQVHHFVDRIYSSVGEIGRLFPRCTIISVLSRSRAPKRWFWDAIVLVRSGAKVPNPWRVRHQ